MFWLLFRYKRGLSAASASGLTGMTDVYLQHILKICISTDWKCLGQVMQNIRISTGGGYHNGTLQNGSYITY
jgi:hypothetical protein